MLQDLRYGLRVLVRAPLFSLTAVLSLAIGIGATSAVFTVANGLLLRAVTGGRSAGGLVDIVRTRSDRGADPGIDPISYPDYLDIRARTQQVSDVYAYQLEVQPASVRLDGVAERIFVNRVSMNYFTALGVRAAAGRLFGAGDSETPGASPLLVLSHRFWTRRLQAESIDYRAHRSRQRRPSDHRWRRRRRVQRNERRRTRHVGPGDGDSRLRSRAGLRGSLEPLRQLADGRGAAAAWRVARSGVCRPAPHR